MDHGEIFGPCQPRWYSSCKVSTKELCEEGQTPGDAARAHVIARPSPIKASYWWLSLQVEKVRVHPVVGGEKHPSLKILKTFLCTRCLVPQQPSNHSQDQGLCTIEPREDYWTCNAEVPLNRITEVIVSSIEAYIPHTLFNPKARKPWFNSACIIMSKIERRLIDGTVTIDLLKFTPFIFLPVDYSVMINNDVSRPGPCHVITQPHPDTPAERLAATRPGGCPGGHAETTERDKRRLKLCRNPPRRSSTPSRRVSAPFSLEVSFNQKDQGPATNNTLNCVQNEVGHCMLEYSSHTVLDPEASLTVSSDHDERPLSSSSPSTLLAHTSRLLAGSPLTVARTGLLKELNTASKHTLFLISFPRPYQLTFNQ
ncbi:hypothetical protein GWK47_043171 [Chionoecetes opilio]|uniref:Uncharacterized protein n=1 Tax=Chionoecetes opilio TaxID=41210 RepID=A0A8J4Y826_CHIOP|nr:hypothetical protein GWK47_043171 [Chionoecetes opilio]